MIDWVWAIVLIAAGGPYDTGLTFSTEAECWANLPTDGPFQCELVPPAQGQ